MGLLESTVTTTECKAKGEAKRESQKRGNRRQVDEKEEGERKDEEESRCGRVHLRMVWCHSMFRNCFESASLSKTE
uniref:Uncharacterized protein n=1 Tax=Vespula pensylvanica TaxID=30213 RepID=A0A834NE96_VESPE|nr:hypothetical protein H0235_014962 [Vespula pensylvanica]